jgi:hypothetical protein
METYQINPKVDSTQEFIEIAKDFSNPLDIVREAISNAYDAKATAIRIIFEVIEEFGEHVLKITLSDNGAGMNREGLQAFFDLGNSLRRNDRDAIGKKGHGTKIYFNSQKICVTTVSTGKKLIATMLDPFKKLHNRTIPTVSVEEDTATELQGTNIEIFGYNNNRRDKFTHEILKDYIRWFTKQGSFENIFNQSLFKNVSLTLKGLGQDEAEEIPWGHYFPDESANLNKLLDDYFTKAPDYYCKQIKKEGRLKNYPDIKYQAIFYVEGKNVKYSYNPMIRRSGYSAPSGAYTIQERYGLWLCKDFIPVQRKNEWISSKGSEYTRFHAFFNCQELCLTANRGSIENTPSEILQDITLEIKKIYDEIIESSDWTALEWLEEESGALETVEKEKKQFEWRIKKLNRSNVAVSDGITLVEPERESGVFSLFLLLSTKQPDLFPFQIIDYDTHEGIDVVAKGDKTTPIVSAKLFYVEFKRTLTGTFNHSFENLHSVVCWETQLKHDDIIKDISGEERKLQIIQPASKSDYTRYFLDNTRKAHKIEVYVLRDFLKQRLNIDFRPRTKDATV